MQRSAAAASTPSGAPPLTEIDVDAAFRLRGGDDAGDVAVGDQHDARAGLAHLADQLLVARPVEDAGDQIARPRTFFALAKAAEILRRLLVEIDQIIGQAAADRDLVHVDVGRVEEAALLRHRDDRKRVGQRPWR